MRDSPDTQEIYKKKGPQDQAWGLCKYKSPKLWPGYQKQGSTRTGNLVSDFPEVRVKKQMLIPIAYYTILPVTKKRTRLIQQKKKSFFLQGEQQFGVICRGWDCRKGGKGRGIKGC